MREVQKRARQLRLAKRAQRKRDRAAGRHLVQLKLPAPIAAKLRAAMRDQDFPRQLDVALDELVVRIDDYPALADLAWNLTLPYLPARQAFALYERNWRHVEESRLIPRERELIERLATRFGGGIIHA